MPLKSNFNLICYQHLLSFFQIVNSLILYYSNCLKNLKTTFSNQFYLFHIIWQINRLIHFYNLTSNPYSFLNSPMLTESKALNGTYI